MYLLKFIVLWLSAAEVAFSLSVNDEHRNPRTHVINFEATSRNNSEGRRIIAINDHREEYVNSFGPSIRVHAGDTINLSLQNRICSAEEAKLGENDQLWQEYCTTGLHFHGLVPIGNAVDGIPGLTQPPIQTGEAFWYNFTIPQDVCGTYWYHSHSTIQYGDGLRGRLVVECDEYNLLVNRVVQSLQRKPADNGLLNLPPKVDTITQEGVQEEYVTLSDWYVDWNLDVEREKVIFPGGTTDPHMDGSLVNGSEEDQLKIDLKPDTKAVVLRLVNAGMAGTQVIHAEEKKMVVIETDGILIKPYAVETLSLAVGQRYTVVLTTDDEPIKFINGCNKMMGYITKVFWMAKNHPTGGLGFDGRIKELPGFYRSELYKELEPLPSANGDNIKILGGPTNDNKSVQRITLNYEYVRDDDNLRQKFGTEMYKVNGKTVQEYMETPIEVVSGKTLEIVINALDHMRHPWHLHGHHFQLVSLGDKAEGALQIDESNFSDEDSALKKYRDDLNYWNQTGKTPMTRDSINIEGRSFAAIRIEPNRPGDWLLHCHVEWHVAKGLGVVIRELPKNPQQLQLHQNGSKSNATEATTRTRILSTSKTKVLSLYFLLMTVIEIVLYWIIM